MGKATKIIILIIIAILAVSGCEYGYHSYKVNKVNKELKNTEVITNEKGGHDVTWDTIKTAAKSNDVLVVFVDSKTPYFNPVMKAVKEEMNKNTKNNPKVLVVDQQQPSYLKLRGELDSTNGLGDYAADPYAIAYKKNQNLTKNHNEMANIHHNFRVENNNTDMTSCPTNIAETNSEDYDVKFPRNEKEVGVDTHMIQAFFDGKWVTYKQDAQ